MTEATHSEPGADAPGFHQLGLSEPVLRALDTIGYESPSSIQAEAIPHLLAGRDIVGQAQTGTGKTAAFALPLLSRLDMSKPGIRALVLVPTRELAIQVAEAFQKYAAHIPGFHVMPIYGGSGYGDQLRGLRRGVQVVVATPGRLTDHIRRNTLSLDTLDCLVIDEADEMLRMGFIDEVDWILEQTPSTRQVALFSATMPTQIRRIALNHLSDPVQVTIRSKTTTAATINQRFWMVSGLHKLDALTRILEGEDFDGMIIFVRTKSATVELVEKLEARGFAAAALNGDIPQNLREKTVDQLRKGDLDILVATDVAARGLDVQRISHIINYDIPNDTESYVHRIGRTGRAGRTGEAILFVAPRERRLLNAIEHATKQKIEMMKLPTREYINDIRLSKFKQRISDALATEQLGFYYDLLEQFRQERNIPALEIAAALAKLLQGDEPLLLETQGRDIAEQRSFDDDRKTPTRKRTDRRERGESEKGFERYRIDVGHAHGVKPGAIVGAIANEAGIDGRAIGRIEIFDDFTVVDLPEGMPGEVFNTLQRTRVCGRPMKITQLDASKPLPDKFKPRPAERPKEGFKKKTFKSRDDFKGAKSFSKKKPSGSAGERPVFRKK